ncbi:hypothetical protein [Nostoc sp. C117]|uniref:hypothetical protein n=1 Tax=Nostoc sp. C117 TaxID=3349875 RepID=UPI00370DAFC9
MHNVELLRFYLFAQKSINQSTLIEAKATGTTHDAIKPQHGDIPFLAVFLAHISFLLVWGIVVYLVSYFCKSLENATQNKDEIVSTKHLDQHPCKNCQFFNNNYYLKCAVNPSTTLTKEALNCSDYKSSIE